MTHPFVDQPSGSRVLVVARFDMVRLAADLRTDGRHPDLVKAVERAASAGSTRDDLRTALVSLDRILEMQAETGDDGAVAVARGDGVVAGALFTQAVILYARATATGSDRPKLLGEAKLSAEERAVHDEAIALRSGCIAHFGRGEDLTDGPMFREAVLFNLLLVDGAPKKQVSVFSTRAHHKVAFAARLAPLIERRLKEIADRIDRLFEAVDVELERAGREDADLRESMGRYEFDVDAFAGSAEGAAALRLQLASGTAIDMDYVVRVPKPAG
ncbi:MAG: hypothetical protein J0J06_03585 [Sphingomonas sp.]|uniref:hypothetical protein n=1 Tax=Sphingomonas sp. TaxID=28214 RepID=UPI001AD55AEC|nr:hypothetical protein [Sphingomonas sp.]MBN8814514.1 hypothetical protein [Sphingomonas sp.]